MESNLPLGARAQRALPALQPKIDLDSGRIDGVEALLRWTSAELGAVPPANFIPLAEEIGLIHTIGRWCCGRACEQSIGVAGAKGCRRFRWR